MYVDYFAIYFDDVTLDYNGTDTVVSEWFEIDYSKAPTQDIEYGYEADFGCYSNLDSQNAYIRTVGENGEIQEDQISYDWNSIWYNFKPVRFRFETAGTSESASGTVIIEFLYIAKYIEYDETTRIPVITINHQDRKKISKVIGHDVCNATFYSDIHLSQWEARATTPGQAVGHGSGLLVASGENLKGGETGEVVVDDEELTNGDLEYTISIFGQSVGGRWSDG